MKGWRIKSKVWIDDNQGIFLGKGRIDLLAAIEEHGSISKAAQSMNMSYLKAWKLVESMNDQGEPLVIRSVGGKDGGGTTLTSRGKRMIGIYNRLNKKCEEYLDRELDKLLKKQRLE